MDASEIVAAVGTFLAAIGGGTWITSLLLRRQYGAAVRGMNATARTDEATAGRTEAELTQILQGVAAESVRWATDQLAAARGELSESRKDHDRDQQRIRRLEDRVEVLEQDRGLHRELLNEHAAVDFLLVERLRAAGVDIADLTPLPPLLLPHR